MFNSKFGISSSIFKKKFFLRFQCFPFFHFYNKSLSANVVLIHSLRKSGTRLRSLITGHRRGRRKRRPRNNFQAGDTRPVIITENEPSAHLIIARKENLLLRVETQWLESVNSRPFERVRRVAQTSVFRVKTARIKIREIPVPATLSRLGKLLQRLI